MRYGSVFSAAASRCTSRRVRSNGSLEPSGNIELPFWSMISMLRPCLVSSIMMCFEISAISGMSCIACRSEAEASAKSPSLSSRAPNLLLRLFSSGLGVAEVSSGLMLGRRS